MSKISLIIQREYLTRVRKKSFVIMSFVGPLLFAAMMVLPAWFASMEDQADKKIAVVDHSGKYLNTIEDTEYYKFSWLAGTNQTDIEANYQQEGYDAYLVISGDLQSPEGSATIYSDVQITIDVKQYISRQLEKFIEQERLNSYQIDGLDEIIKNIHNVNVDVSIITLGDDGSQKESFAEVTMIAAIVFAMLVYFFVLMYGTQVMRGVIEEKTNRIVEVIVSSIRPFQLMMGKIIGIAMVALTQFLLWVVFTLVIILGVKTVFFGNEEMPTRMDGQIEMVQGVNGVGDQDQTAEFAQTFKKILDKTKGLDLIGSLVAFVFYFLGGYLLYAGLFAALGAALDSETDSQQFVMPVMMPLILSIYVAMAAMRNPDGDIAFWFSMIPFTSPIVMMARIPFQPPVWEIALSMTLLAGSFVFTTWFAGRIYRTGILMYGKKVSYKELWKWFLYSKK